MLKLIILFQDGKTALMRAKESKWSNRLIVSLLEGASERRVPIVSINCMDSELHYTLHCPLYALCTVSIGQLCTL